MRGTREAYDEEKKQERGGGGQVGRDSKAASAVILSLSGEV